MRDYSQDYSPMRTINQPHGFESLSNSVSEVMGNYSSSITSCPPENEMQGSSHCLLPNFPSYFSNREGKSPRNSNLKQNKSQHATCMASCTNESGHSQSDHSLVLSPNFHQNI